MCRRLLLSLVLLCLAACGEAKKKIRGLNPALADRYSGSGGIFQCLDGSKAIPFDRVNDDFCDCADGSDEPGTSACANGRFYCLNRGHEPQSISASFVDDGVCGEFRRDQMAWGRCDQEVGSMIRLIPTDCCDGTDERRGCVSTCLDKASGKLIELQTKVASYGDMLAKKASYVEQAALRRKEWNARAETIDIQLQNKRSAVEAAKGEAHASPMHLFVIIANLPPRS